VIVYATEITPPIFPHPTEGCLNAMSQMNIAEAGANHAVFREKRLTPAGATEMYRFLATNEESLRNVRLHANVAVVASLRQFLADELSFAFSASRVLADNGIGHVMLTEDDLSSPTISQFDMVVVPYLPLMSSENQQALVRYAKAGGTLLVLGASGNKDQYGLTQRQIPLAQPLGNGQYPATEVTRRVDKGQVLFIPVQIPPSRFLIPMKSHGDYTTFGPTMADIFADIPEGYTRDRIDPEIAQTSGASCGHSARESRYTRDAPDICIAVCRNYYDDGKDRSMDAAPRC